MGLIKKTGGEELIRERVIFGFVFLIFLIMFIATGIRNGASVTIKLNAAFEGTLKSKSTSRSEVLLCLEEYPNYLSVAGSRNYNYKPAGLSDFLSKGDYIIKRRCSDTLFIIRQDLQYHFIIGDLNYNNPDRSEQFKRYWANKRTIITEESSCQ